MGPLSQYWQAIHVSISHLPSSLVNLTNTLSNHPASRLRLMNKIFHPTYFHLTCYITRIPTLPESQQSSNPNDPLNGEAAALESPYVTADVHHPKEKIVEVEVEILFSVVVHWYSIYIFASIACEVTVRYG